MSKSRGRWIRKDKRLAIYLRDGFICIYCLMDLHKAKPRNITLDHVIPVSLGGNNKSNNLVTSCRRCNSSRKNKSLHKFADLDAIDRVKQNTRRSLRRYLKLARNLIDEKKDGK